MAPAELREEDRPAVVLVREVVRVMAREALEVGTEAVALEAATAAAAVAAYGRAGCAELRRSRNRSSGCLSEWLLCRERT